MSWARAPMPTSADAVRVSHSSIAVSNRAVASAPPAISTTSSAHARGRPAAARRGWRRGGGPGRRWGRRPAGRRRARRRGRRSTPAGTSAAVPASAGCRASGHERSSRRGSRRAARRRPAEPEAASRRAATCDSMIGAGREVACRRARPRGRGRAASRPIRRAPRRGPSRRRRPRSAAPTGRGRSPRLGGADLLGRGRLREQRAERVDQLLLLAAQREVHQDPRPFRSPVGSLTRIDGAGHGASASRGAGAWPACRSARRGSSSTNTTDRGHLNGDRCSRRTR